MTIYNSGENNLIKDESVFEIDSANGNVILFLPLISSYIGTGTGAFNKTFTYNWTDKAKGKNNYTFKMNPEETLKTSILISDSGNAGLTLRIMGKYSDSSSWKLSSMLSHKQ
jgi:hypothetical protein